MSCKIFNKDLVVVHVKKPVVKLDRPSYVGMSILDISKTLMYSFHYYHMKNYKCQLLYAIKWSIKTYTNSSTSTYMCLMTKHSPYYFTDYKKVISKFKCEEGQNCITEFVGLRSKMYSYKTYSRYEKRCYKEYQI